MPDWFTNEILRPFAGGVPPVLFDGGAVLFGGVFVWVLGQFVLAALRGAVQSGFEDYFRRHPGHVGALVLCMVLALYSVSVGHYVTLALGASVLVIAMAVGRWLPGRIPRSVAVVVFVAAVAGGEGWGWWHPAPQVPVYVSLAFRGNALEDKDTLRRISQTFRNTLASCFETLQRLRIQPTSFDNEAFDLWTPENHQRMARQLGVTPKLVLANTANVVDAHNGDRGLVLLTEVNAASTDGPLRPLPNPIREAGADSEIRYLSVRAAFDLLSMLKNHPGFELTAAEEHDVKVSILSNFKDFMLVKDPDNPVLAEIDASLGGAAIADGEVEKSLASYRSRFVAEVRSEEVRRTKNSVATKMAALVQ